MLSELDIRNFTTFEQANFKFSPGLNVIIGANGAGKSHVLKLAYSLSKTSYNQKDPHRQSKTVWQKEIANDLIKIFRPENLGRLARRQQGNNKAQVSIKFQKDKEADISMSFSSRSNTDVVIDNEIPSSFASSIPIFIPTKELLSLFPGLRSLYNTYQLSIDETYPDLCDRLDLPLLKGLQLELIKNEVGLLEETVGGEIRNENGRFYLYQNDGGRLEIDLVAEGWRKLATLAYLLKNGSINKSATLFWDEPESNLNPLLIKKLAGILMILSSLNFQIIIATHSLFLLKELHIINKKSSKNKLRYFGLSLNDKNASEVNCADDLEALADIASLEAEMEQADRFAYALNNDDIDNQEQRINSNQNSSQNNAQFREWDNIIEQSFVRFKMDLHKKLIENNNQIPLGKTTYLMDFDDKRFIFGGRGNARNINFKQFKIIYSANPQSADELKSLGLKENLGATEIKYFYNESYAILKKFQTFLKEDANNN